MYSSGEAYFDVVLKSFGQPQPFFCLENDQWRIIGLDTAYAGGRLRPRDLNDPIQVQWNWLIDLLKKSGSKRNILLTHHQPVSAHSKEFQDSKAIRDDAEELPSTPGVDKDAIFAWFFGHEHRCAVYRDSETPFNARQIGNGCVGHEVQTEKEADPGWTLVDYFNKRQNGPDSGAAISSFAMLTFDDASSQLRIEYLDEDFEVWGTEMWDAQKGRLGGCQTSRAGF
jgi:hypothetical protein